MRRDTTLFIAMLTEEEQATIYKALQKALYRQGIRGEEQKEILGNAMADRVCLLEDFIPKTLAQLNF